MTDGPESLPGCFGRFMRPLDLLICLDCEAAELCRKNSKLICGNCREWRGVCGKGKGNVIAAVPMCEEGRPRR